MRGWRQEIERRCGLLSVFTVGSADLERDTNDRSILGKGPRGTGDLPVASASVMSLVQDEAESNAQGGEVLTGVLGVG